MPPKSSSSKSSNPQGPSKAELQAINTYLSQKPDFEKLIREAKENPKRSLPPKRETEYDRRIKEAVREVLEERQREAKARDQNPNMPVGRKEEEAGDNLTDLVAQQSKDSSASDHPLHTGGDQAKPLATAEDHKANPGPVMAENIGEPASKEELKKRAEELNKKSD